MSDITIQAKDNGPFIVKGDAFITDGSGQSFETKDPIALCRCGVSGKRPFCDGTHAKIGFEAAEKADQQSSVA